MGAHNKTVSRAPARLFTERDEHALRELWALRLSAVGIGKVIGRSAESVQCAARRMCLPYRARIIPATKQQIDELREQYGYAPTAAKYVSLAAQLGIRRFYDKRFGVAVPYIEMLHGPLSR